MNRFRKIIRVSAAGVLTLVVLLVIFHFWLIAHAENILAEIVYVQSKGKHHLEIEKVKYNYLKLRLELEHPVLTSLDTSGTVDRFDMHASSITLQLEKLWPLISGRQLLIDSILLDHPTLNLVHQKRNANQNQKTAFSLSFEMEKLYQSIQSVLTTLKVAHFRINKGAFTLNSTSQKNPLPLNIKDIDFLIKGFNIDSATISQHPNSYTEEIEMNIAGQTIQFPDGNKSIKFSAFRFIANKGILEVDSCSISGGDNDSTKANFNLFATKMRIKNVFLAANDSTDYNRIDSLFFTRPKVSFSIQIKDAKQDSSESITKAIRKITSAAFGRLLVRYVSINNVDFDIEVERKEKLSTFNFVQDSLVVANLGVGIFPSMPLSASSIRFGVKEFVDYFRDSTYLVHFDSVRINNDQFSLFNINVESTARVKKGQQKIFIPTLQIQGIDWYQLISQKKLVASDFILHDPSISIMAAGTSKNKQLKKGTSVEGLLRQIFVLKNITIINGSVNYAFSGNEYINVKKINTFLTPGLPSPNLVTSFQEMIRNFNTGELVYLKGGYKMIAQHIIYDQHNILHAGNIDLTNSLQNLRVKANNVSISGLSGETKVSSLDIKKITWGSANISIDLSKKRKASSNSQLSIGAVNGGPTELKLFSNKTNIEAKVSSIHTGMILLENGKPKELQDLFTEGNAIDITGGNAKFHSGKFSIRDNSPSSLAAVAATLPLKKGSLSLTIPEVDFETNVQRSISNPLDISWLKLLQPKIDIKFTASAAPAGIKKQQPFPELNLRNIAITDPLISFHNDFGKEPLQLNPGNAAVSISGIKTSDNGERLNFTDLQIQSRNSSLNNRDSLFVSSPNGTVRIGTRSFILYSNSSNNSNRWQLDEGAIDLSNINLLNKRVNSQADTLLISSLKMNHVFINENNIKDLSNYLASSPTAVFSNLDINYKNHTERFHIKGLKGNSSSLSLDSFSYRPQQNRNAFLSAHKFQKDYITVETGPVLLNSIDFASWFKDSILRVGNIHIGNAIMNATRDKNMPLEDGITKGLPVTLIKDLPIKTRIDSIIINNGRIRYHEVSEKTRQTGNIRFTRLNAVISNIKNFNLQPDDSLQLVATGYLMDSAHIQFRMKESYVDSLASFPFVVKVMPFDIKILNPFLLPVMSVRIKSGISDSIQIRALAREYLSLGEMRFFYHDLKVEFLKDGNDQKKTLLTSLITFAANSFVIRTNNRKRVGKIFFERMRNRSFFNYLVKMVASGAASSVGAKRNKKYNRIYDDKIRELSLPGIEY